MSNIKILTTAKKRSFESVPPLSKDARKGYFLIDPETKRILSTFKNDDNKVCFLIQQAYFQAKGRFFNINKCKAIDKRFAEKALGLKLSINVDNYTSQTASNHKKIILEKFKWQAFKSCHKQELYEHAKTQVDKRYSKEVVFFALLNYCWLHRIEIPGYDTFSTIVSDSFYQYEKNIIHEFSNCLTDQQTDILENFLTINERQYTLRDLKKIDQGDTQKVLNKNASLLAIYRDAFCTIKPILNSLSLSKDAINYFSDWVYKSNISQITQLKDANKRYLYITAFISDQFFKRQDFASDAIQKVLRSKVNKAKGYERKCKQEQELETNEANKSVMNSAKSSKQILKLILEISENSTLEYAERNERVIQLVSSYFEAENPNLGHHIEKIERSISKASINEDFYKYLFSSYLSIQRSLGPLIKEMIFDENSIDSDLLKAIYAYKSDSIDLDDSDSTDFLKKNEFSLIKKEDNTPVISKLKIILFIHISQALKGQGITMDFSYRYKHTSHYQISDEEWKKKRDSILKATSLDRFSDGKAILSVIGQKVTATFIKTNEKIKNKENQFFIQKADGTWRVKDSDADYDVSKYIPTLLSNNNTVMLQDMVSEIDNHTKFTDYFKHSSLRDANNQIDVRLLYATIMSLGTNMGHTSMSKSSRIFSEKALRDTENNWLANKNIKLANDIIVKTIQSLPLPTVFNDQFGRLHTSSDGKKVVVAVNSLLANYSYKYYGKEQGISVNSFLDEKQSFFHVNVLTASDREAPYMMDGIVSSKSTFESEALNHHMHSTDTHVLYI